MEKKDNYTRQLKSELKELKEHLSACKKQFYNIVGKNRDGILVLNRQGEIVYANHAAQVIFGRNIGQLLGEQFGVLVEGDYESEIPIPSSKGKTICVELLVSKIEWKNESSTLVFVHDISGRKKAEERIKKSMEEKKVLLKEIHHRVKNNLQIISSLLILQRGYIKDKEALRIFIDTQERIRTMALIHERLYQSDDVARVNFPKYIRELVAGLFQAYSCQPDRVQFNIDVEDISLNIDTAIPVGLIINELVSNSLKHAFPGNRKGEVYVKLGKSNDRGKEGEDSYVLVIGDNGIGFPAGFDYHKSGRLGMTLLDALVKQLYGIVDIEREKGTQFTVKFKQKAARSKF